MSDKIENSSSRVPDGNRHHGQLYTAFTHDVKNPAEDQWQGASSVHNDASEDARPQGGALKPDSKTKTEIPKQVRDDKKGKNHRLQTSFTDSQEGRGLHHEGST
jgi:hypothetical protein